MNINTKFNNYLKIQKTKVLFLLVSLFLNPLYALYASTKSSYKSVINNSKITLTKNKINNKINILEEKFISQNDTRVIDHQNIKSEFISSQKDLNIEDLEDEINRTIYQKNINNPNKKIFKNETYIDFDNTPPSGKISVGEFLIPARGYINLEGPKITLNIVEEDALEALKFLAKSGDYGFLYISKGLDENVAEDEKNIIPKITANFVNEDYSRVFNSLLMASNLQAKFEKGIIFVGEDIFNKSLEPKFSKTYRINQASASSVGDYLSTLGAKISKVLVKSSAIAGDELGSSLTTSADLSENFINSYGVEGGPLTGLIGTVDLRLQTITLVGEKGLIATAEKYIKSLDVRHRQVALSVKIIDVSLTKSDLTNNRFEGGSGGAYFINNGGLNLSVTNDNSLDTRPNNSAIESLLTAGQMGNNKFVNWLERKITNDNAKIIASPTLILGENQEPIISGAAANDDSLGSASIGRPFANEAFIKVGENVITSFEANTTDGVTTCTAVAGIAGITFGAKLNKIDDNGFVTFSLSPAISSVTRTETVANCGTQSTLSVRRLDTGIIRVKDGNTLVLTGVLKDEDTINTTKTPLLGDVPILGRLFRKNTTLKRKSELIILVTPNVIKDDEAWFLYINDFKNKGIMTTSKFKQIDILRKRRESDSLQKPYFIDTKKFIFKGIYIGLSLISISFLIGLIFIIRSNIIARKKSDIKPLVDQYDSLQIKLDEESKQLKVVAAFNKKLKNSIVNVSSSSALLSEVALIIPKKIQMINLSSSGNILNIKNQVSNYKPFELINGFLISLDNSEFINFSEIDLSNIELEEKEKKSFVFNISTKITTEYEEINQKYLKILGSEGLSNRIDVLNKFEE